MMHRYQLSSDQEAAYRYITENIHFYAAPFWNPYVFQKWTQDLIRHAMGISKLEMLTNQLLAALNEDLGIYEIALKAYVSINEPSDVHLIHLILKNPEFVETLLRLSKDGNVNFLISDWNHYYNENRPSHIPTDIKTIRSVIDEKIAKELEEKKPIEFAEQIKNELAAKKQFEEYRASELIKEVISKTKEYIAQEEQDLRKTFEISPKTSQILARI